MAGGYRPGSGRKPANPILAGAESKGIALANASALTKAKAQALSAACAGMLLTPEEVSKLNALDVMENVMHFALASGQHTLALSAASQLAPYRSPKLSQITNVVTTEPTKMSDAELLNLLAQLKKAEASKVDAVVDAADTNVVRLNP